MKAFRPFPLLIAAAMVVQTVAPVAAQETTAGAATVRIEYLPLTGPPLLLYRNARQALADGNAERAIADLREAIRQRPDAGELRLALVEALLAAGRNGEAREAALFAASDPDVDAETRRQLAAKAGEIREDPVAATPAPATEVYQAANAAAVSEATIDPELDDDAIRLLAERAAAIREGRAQEEADEEAGEIAAEDAQDAPLSTDDPAYKAADTAYRAFERGRYAEAVAAAEEAVRLAPQIDDYRTLLDNARTALAEERARQAAAAKEAAEAEPTPPEPVAEPGLDAEAVRRLSERAAGIRQERDGQTAQAAQSPVAAAPEEPPEAALPATEDPAYKAADAAYRAYENGEYRKAVINAGDAVRLAPDNDDYRALLDNAEKALAEMKARTAAASPAARAAEKAYAALRRDDPQAALGPAWQAARHAPGNRSYQVLLVDVLNRNGDREDALRVVDAAIARFGPDRTLLGQRGVIRQALGDQTGARADFEQALALPGETADETGLRLNLAAAAMATDAPETAYQALMPLGDSPDAAVWLARAKALTAMESFTAAATALEQAERLAKGERQQADVAIAGLDLLMAEGKNRRARAGLRAAAGDGVLAPIGPTETAYLAARLGDRALAYDAFSKAYQAGDLDGSQLIDAAYAARRDYHNEDAVSWLKRAIDEVDAGRLSLSPEGLFSLRREVSDISRRWGANIGLFYGSTGISDGYITPPASAGRSMQLGSEVFWRPPVIGYRDGRTVDLFVRQFTTVYDSLGGAVGLSTMQGAAGVRVKPFTNLNLALEAARYFKIGRYSRDDTLVRAAISDGFNTDLMPGSDAWWTGWYYGEAGRYFDSDEDFALANASLGRSFALNDDGTLIVTPYIGIAADYNNTYATEFALGAGPGINLRYWFRQTQYEAPMSHIDINGQYRARLGGDDRARGWFASLNLMI
ncbi:tetratricopeptide repeat protein [Martelella sp. AD-3]|uniref:NfrA family protein n=1 Tax=Martelella sp. AD-3 TaxID=686597 RepID=UPI0004B21AED|nr:tetratricopeptide repeat protein [Martelella sp. AD-3]